MTGANQAGIALEFDEQRRLQMGDAERCSAAPDRAGRSRPGAPEFWTVLAPFERAEAVVGEGLVAARQADEGPGIAWGERLAAVAAILIDDGGQTY